MLIVHSTNYPWDIWGIPKGIPNKYECHDDAMYREIYEETNIALADYKHMIYDIGYQLYRNKNKKLHGFIVILNEYDYPDIYCSSTFTSGNNDIIQPEIDGFSWLPIKDAIKRIQPEQKNLILKNINKLTN
jgi:8-oxo-dGTP pyrophosphatase MutT (NUDIX family)